MYIIAKRPRGSGGIPEFSLKPVFHFDLNETEMEAARLAQQHQGHEFIIFTALKKTSIELPRVQWEDMS